MDFLKKYRDMISLRGLTDHTVKSYSTYLRSYLEFISERVLGSKFKGKFLDSLDRFYKERILVFPKDCRNLEFPTEWNAFRDSLERD